MRLYDSLVDDLYFELLINGDYQEGLNLLRRALDAHAGGILKAQVNGVTMLTGQGLNPESVTIYNSDLNAEDYMLPFINSNSKDKLLVASNLVDFREIEKTDYYQFVDKPSDVHDKMSFHIVTPLEQYAVVLYRDKKRPYSRQEHEWARKLQPHVARCFRLVSKKSKSFNLLLMEKGLTKREVEIATSIVIGNDYSKIRSGLGISTNTLKWHMKNIFQKFAVRNLAELSVQLRSALLDKAL